MSVKSFFRYDTGFWEPPSPEEIREFLKVAELSSGTAGKLVGVKNREFRRWTCDPEAKGFKVIPYSAWRLLLLETGLADQRAAVIQYMNEDSEFSSELSDCGCELRFEEGSKPECIRAVLVSGEETEYKRCLDWLRDNLPAFYLIEEG